MRLSHNMASLNIYRYQIGNLEAQNKAMNNISSGYKVNSAKDNPNAIAQSEKMRMQIRGMQMAAQNAQNGISMLQTTDGVLDNVTSLLQRIRELAVQSGDANNDQDKQTIQNEIKQMTEGIDNAVKQNNFNGINIINDNNVTDNASPEILNIPSGANVGEKIKLPNFKLTSDMIGDSAAGKTLKDIDITAANGSDEALKIVDGALKTVLSARSQYGAIENRLEDLDTNLDGMSTIVQGAESGLRDADIAAEMIELSKSGLLVEAGNAMMVQTNNFPKDILRVLQNVK